MYPKPSNMSEGMDGVLLLWPVSFFVFSHSSLLLLCCQFPHKYPRLCLVFTVCAICIWRISSSAKEQLAEPMQQLCFSRPWASRVQPASAVYLGQNQDNKNTRCKCKGSRSDVKMWVKKKQKSHTLLTTSFWVSVQKPAKTDISGSGPSPEMWLLISYI